jgi:hypothetical protein
VWDLVRFTSEWFSSSALSKEKELKSPPHIISHNFTFALASSGHRKLQISACEKWSAFWWTFGRYSAIISIGHAAAISMPKAKPLCAHVFCTLLASFLGIAVPTPDQLGPLLSQQL